MSVDIWRDSGAPSRLSLPPDLSRLPEVRAWAWEAGSAASLPEARIFDLQVTVSEATANAIEHAASGVELMAWLLPDRLIVEVTNDGVFQPGLYKDHEGRRRGLGLPLIVSLADQVHVSRLQDNRTRVSLTFFLEGYGRQLSWPDPAGAKEIHPGDAESLYRNLVELSPDAILVHIDGTYVFANPAAARLFSARSPDELIGMKAIERLHPDDRELLVRRMSQVLAGGVAPRAEGRMLRLDGTCLFVESTGSRVEFGGRLAIQVIIRDITERKLAEAALSESEERFRVMFESHGAAMLLIEPDSGQITDANEAAVRFYGYSRDQLRAMRIDQINQLPPEEVAAQRRNAVDENKNLFVFPHRLASGEVRFVEVYSSRVAIRGRPMLFSIIQDITERKRAAEALRETEERSAFLLQLTDALRPLSDPIAIQEAASRLLGERLKADRVTYFEVRGDDYVVERDYAPSVPHLSGRYPIAAFGERLLATYRAGRMVVSNDIAEDPIPTRERDSFFSIGVRAQISAPLIKNGEFVAGLAVHSATPRVWKPQEMRLMEEVAERTWAAVERGRAEAAQHETEERYRALAEENERLYRQQLDIAENLQAAFLHIPSELGPVRLGHLYRSATEAARVGGDFYDVFEVKENKIAVLMGDVAGHGIEAARTATLVKDVVHAFIHQTLRTQEVLRLTNGLLIEKELPGYVTLFLGILDTKTCELQYSSAGHPDMLMRRASAEIEHLGAGSAPLGIYADAVWKPAAVEFRVDDLLVLFTDGVIEARHVGELFGEKRLETLVGGKRIPAERLPDVILDQVLAFSEGVLQDDVAILTVRLKNKGAGDEPREKSLPKEKPPGR